VGILIPRRVIGGDRYDITSDLVPDPVRQVYAYLAHLAEVGLVERNGNLGSKLHFQITERGLERLKWLRDQHNRSALDELILPLLRSSAASARS